MSLLTLIRACRSFYAVIILVSMAATLDASPRYPALDRVAPPDIRITRFDDVVANVLGADRAEQARFAKIAIDNVVAAYLIELERYERKAADRPRDGSRWRSGTRRYIEDLQETAASIGPRSSLQIIKERHGAIRLVVDGRQVMLSAPRLDDQVEFEGHIAASVCRFSDCAAPGATVEDRVAARTAALQSSWAFGRKTPPTYSSSDGLRCTFKDRRHLKLKKDACVNLLHEIRLLTEAIATLRAHGKTIEWRHLRIDQLGPGRPQKVTYRSSGNFVNLQVPNLVRAQSVWRGALPWIKASLQGRITPYIIELPDQVVYLTLTTHQAVVRE